VSTLQIEADYSVDTQTNFDTVCGITLDLLDTFYPEREITVTSSDPRTSRLQSRAQGAAAAKESPDARRADG